MLLSAVAITWLQAGQAAHRRKTLYSRTVVEMIDNGQIRQYGELKSGQIFAYCLSLLI